MKTVNDYSHNSPLVDPTTKKVRKYKAATKQELEQRAYSRALLDILYTAATTGELPGMGGGAQAPDPAMAPPPPPDPAMMQGGAPPPPPMMGAPGGFGG